MPALFSENYRELQEKIGYCFKNVKYLETALTHRSYKNSGENYELLEFLGDSIVNFLVVCFLVENFPNYKEGTLASIKAYLVSEEFLSSISEELGMQNYVRISGKRRFISSSVLADLFEALLGAIYMDSGGDMNGLKQLFFKKYGDRLREVVEKELYKKDYKTLLQELTQSKWKERPIYRVVGVSGKEHERVFEVECCIREYRAIGRGRNKKEAQQEAAKKVYEMLQNA
ncbi:ribonuclease III [Thermocrinis jamiesonii]|jgi:ribonuclease III, bacterial|uniref:ribonuclease III n=1 Tax=Thermocrinis jamiesonii TaxID=1302351 RepID=UPI00049512F2|nr:ribonuclease III [Thermocrinis jamiesonii]